LGTQRLKKKEKVPYGDNVSKHTLKTPRRSVRFWGPVTKGRRGAIELQGTGAEKQVEEERQKATDPLLLLWVVGGKEGGKTNGVGSLQTVVREKKKRERRVGRMEMGKKRWDYFPQQGRGVGSRSGKRSGAPAN